ncbi:MAG: heterodisulfide reductase-related iron-sulfur binding cluster [Thermoguttaceae bacterium]|nr:heterodisulfide reductase-related iron-sulfur binding cluster [Thermoguttaceae bacterium]MDW8079487.1 heterodisulfide reductase-related iron-sulfur binding cluster [Thermoguttaceae bacterium]
MTGQPVEPQLEFVYYPGCSLQGVNWEYDASFRAVCHELGISLIELDGWTCCGGSSAHSIDPVLASRLARENLALAGKSGKVLVAPCPACYQNLRRGQGALPAANEKPQRAKHGVPPPRKLADSQAGQARSSRPGNSQPCLAHQGVEPTAKEAAGVGGECFAAPTTLVFHVNEFFHQPPVWNRLRQAIRRPLVGLKPVAYYGCLVSRVGATPGSREVEDPTHLEKLLELAGASVCPWAYKTDCCGGSLGLTRPAIVNDLVAQLVDEAIKAGANCLVTDCPLCFANLDGRQLDVLRKDRELRLLPVFYISEVLALALGLRGVATWLSRHCVDPFPLLESLGFSREDLGKQTESWQV